MNSIESSEQFLPPSRDLSPKEESPWTFLAYNLFTGGGYGAWAVTLKQHRFVQQQRECEGLWMRLQGKKEVIAPRPLWGLVTQVAFEALRLLGMWMASVVTLGLYPLYVERHLTRQWVDREQDKRLIEAQERALDDAIRKHRISAEESAQEIARQSHTIRELEKTIEEGKRIIPNVQQQVEEQRLNCAAFAQEVREKETLNARLESEVERLERPLRPIEPLYKPLANEDPRVPVADYAEIYRDIKSAEEVFTACFRESSPTLLARLAPVTSVPEPLLCAWIVWQLIEAARLDRNCNGPCLCINAELQMMPSHPVWVVYHKRDSWQTAFVNLVQQDPFIPLAHSVVEKLTDGRGVDAVSVKRILARLNAGEKDHLLNSLIRHALSTDSAESRVTLDWMKDPNQVERTNLVRTACLLITDLVAVFRVRFAHQLEQFRRERQ